MKKTILRAAVFTAVAALLFTACDDNGLNRSPSNDGWVDGFIKRFNNVDERSVPHKVTVESDGIDKFGDGTFSVGVVVTIMAGDPKDDDWQFKEWTSTNPEIAFGDYDRPMTTFTMPATDVTVKAVFERKPTYKVTYDLNGGQGTAPTDDRSYKYDEEATVKDIVDVNEEVNLFTGWNTQEDGSGASYAGGKPLTIKDNTTLYAQWASSEAELYEVKVTRGTGGKLYEAGSEVTITADESAAEQFVEWIVVVGDVTLGNVKEKQTTFTMPNRAVEVEARFESIKRYTVNAVSDNEWVQFNGKGEYKAGDTVTLTARSIPTNMRVDRWQSTPSVTFTTATNGNAVSFIMPAYAVNITLFVVLNTTPKTEYKLTISVSPNNGGKVNLASGTMYTEGAQITVEATPNSGFVFSKWDGALTSTKNKETLIMDANKTLTAIFVQSTTPTYAVTVSSAGSGASGGGNYAQGTTVTINAGTLPNGQQFKNWTVTSGSGVTFANANSATTTFTMPGNAVTVTAVFETVSQQTYQVTVSSAGTGATSGGSYAQGVKVSIDAGTPPAGQRFKNWTSDVENVIFESATSARTAFTMPGSAVTVKAEFEPASGEFTDIRDNQTYKYVTMGTQVWMAQNLNHNAADSWCYDGKEENCAKYGRLYKIETAKNVCPGGWRLPSRAEAYDSLILKAAGGSTSETAQKLKAKTPDWNGTDIFGFTALPGGFLTTQGTSYKQYSDGGYTGATNSQSSAIWWTSSPYISSSTGKEDGNYTIGVYSYVRTINGLLEHSIEASYSPYTDNTERYYSVRCVRD